jgi:hypothetical protein
MLWTPGLDVIAYATMIACVGLLLVGDFVVAFTVARTSLTITVFPLSTHASGGSRTVGLTNTVIEVEGILEVEATYPSLVLLVWHF